MKSTTVITKAFAFFKRFGGRGAATSLNDGEDRLIIIQKRSLKSERMIFHSIVF